MPRKAVTLDPTNADLYGQLGDVYKRGRNFENGHYCIENAPCAVVLLPNPAMPATVARPVILVYRCSPCLSIPIALLIIWTMALSCRPLPRSSPPTVRKVVSVLTQLEQTYPDNTVITRNADVGPGHLCRSLCRPHPDAQPRHYFHRNPRHNSRRHSCRHPDCSVCRCPHSGVHRLSLGKFTLPIPNTKYRITNAELRIPNTKLRIPIFFPSISLFSSYIKNSINVPFLLLTFMQKGCIIGLALSP